MKEEVDLSELSAEDLEELAKKAAALAIDLRSHHPTIQIAIANGIRDHSYVTPEGTIHSYEGQTEFTMANGQRWAAIGHKAVGNLHHIDKDGFIEFIPLNN